MIAYTKQHTTEVSEDRGNTKPFTGRLGIETQTFRRLSEDEREILQRHR